MIDYSKYNYTPIENYRNVVLRTAKALDTITNAKLESEARNVVHPLAMRHHDWLFVAPESFGQTAKNFTVYKDGEELGSVIVSHSGVYEIINKRINKARIKAGGMRTSDAKRAVKLIEKFFDVRSASVLVKEANDAVSSARSDAQWRKRHQFESIWDSLGVPLATYILQNLDTLRPTLENMGASGVQLDMLGGKLEMYRAVQNVFDTNTTTKCVVLSGGKYIMFDPKGDPNVYTETADPTLLPDTVRANLGILKMQEVREQEQIEYIQGIGGRISTNVFLVVE